MNNVAVAVSDDLKFDMMRTDNEFLQVNVTVAESLFRFVTRGVETGHEAGLVVSDAHPAPAASGRCFDHYRVTDLFRDLHRLFFVRNDTVAPGRDRHAGFLGKAARRVLIAHAIHRFCWRADELDVAALADLGEVRVLG